MNLRRKSSWLGLFFLSLTISMASEAQLYDTGSIFQQPVLLDTYVIKSGFDVNAFIRRVKRDTTFYKAFRSMHLLPYNADNHIVIWSNSGKDTVATNTSATRQEITNRCRSTRVISQHTTGSYYDRKGENNYYTAALFDYLFFTDDTVCNEDDIVAGKMDAYGKGRMEKSKYKLKQLIFNPGSKVDGIPFMADRASIFEPGEAEKYNFSIAVDTLGAEPCYVFSITPKKGYEHKVLYDVLITWFRKTDYSILARDYSLSYHTLVYDFDVKMKVRTKQIGDKIYPSFISYYGNWHVFPKQRERVAFTIGIKY